MPGDMLRRWRTVDRTLARPDVVLTTIPVAFLLAGLVATLTPVATGQAVVAASVIGAVAVADGLFVHPPRRGEGGPGQGGRLAD